MAPVLTHQEYLSIANAVEGWRITGTALETAQREHVCAGRTLTQIALEAITKGLTAPGLAALMDIPEQQLADLLNRREQETAPQRSVPPVVRQEFPPREARRIWSTPKVTEFLRKHLQDNLQTTEEIHSKLIQLGAWRANSDGDHKAYDALHNYLTHYRGIFYIQEGDRMRAAKPHEVVSPLHVIQRLATKNGWLNAFEFAEEFTIGPNGGKLFYNYVMTTLNCLAREGLVASAPATGDHACYVVRPANLGAILRIIDNYTKLNATEDERAQATRALQNLLHPAWYFKLCEETQKAGKALPPNRVRNGRQA